MSNLSDGQVIVTSLTVAEVNQALLDIQERIDRVRGLRGRAVVYDRLGVEPPVDATDAVTLATLDDSQQQQYLDFYAQLPHIESLLKPLKDTVDYLLTLVHAAGDSGGSGTAPADAQYVTLSTNATLTQERVLTAGTNVLLTDAGAGSTLTVAVGSQNWAFPGDISPAQITSNQDDYNPSGLSTATTLRLSSDASRNITGIQGGADGRILILYNIGAQDIVLKDDTTSTAANRFQLNGDVTMAADEGCILQYDGTVVRWRMVGRYVASSGVSGGAANKIAYWTGATTLSNDTSLHWDATNNILGVGATSAGTSGNMVASFGLGTAPTTGVTDVVQLYAIDEGPGFTSFGITIEDGTKHMLGRQFIVGSQTRTTTLTRGVYVDGTSGTGMSFVAKLSGVAHGMTTLTETDNYGDISAVPTAVGGIRLRGYSNGQIGAMITGLYTTDDTTLSTAGVAAVYVEGNKKSATTTGPSGTSANLFAVGDKNTGISNGSALTQFIVNQAGRTWQTGGSIEPVIVLAQASNKTMNASTETNYMVTNEGATTRIDYSLPAAAAGITYTFYVQDTDGVRVQCVAGDTIRLAATVSASGGRIDSTTVGDCVTLVAINATEWVATSLVGAGWTVT